MRKLIVALALVGAVHAAHAAGPVQWYAATADAGCQPQVDPEAARTVLHEKGINSTLQEVFTPDGKFVGDIVRESAGYTDYFFLNVSVCMAFVSKAR